MIKDTLQFFKQEKIYALFLLVIVAIYGTVWYRAQQEIPKEESSHALDQFHQVETKFQEKVKDPASFKKFLETHPRLGVLFNALSAFLFSAFIAGIFIDFSLLFKPRWRYSFAAAGPPQTTKWRLSMIFKVVLLFLTASFLAGLILGLIRKIAFPLSSENLYLLLHTTVTDILVFMFIVWVIREAGGDWKDIGLRFSFKDIPREIMVGLGGYTAILPFFIAMLIFLLLLSKIFSYEPPTHPLVSVFLEEEERSPWLVFYSIFLAVIVGPIFEEIFFRGFCYSVFKKRLGIKWAMALSAAFFAAIHGNLFAFLPIFILGMALAWIYEQRGSLLACMTLHIVHNAVFITYFFVAKAIMVKETGF